MLKRFEVENFKGFQDKITFDLSQSKDYQFAKEAVRDGIINTAIIYGENGSGKSNLSVAIFDIISNLTDHNDGVKSSSNPYRNYRNADTARDSSVNFRYDFYLNKSEISYLYSKKSKTNIIKEKLIINDNIVIEMDKERGISKVNLPGSESLKKPILDELEISLVKYVLSNTSLDKRKSENKTFNCFIDFVNHMLFFKNVEGNAYIGYKNNQQNIIEAIVAKNKVDDFQNFINACGLNYRLKASDIGEEEFIYAVFKNGNKQNFYSIASSGTKSLTLLYYWLMMAEEDYISFLLIDEFDANYHHELAYLLAKRLRDNVDLQVILTTHNVNIMDNDLLRPDCYFIIDNNKINPLYELTNKEIRKANNLAKLYVAGEFNE